MTFAAFWNLELSDSLDAKDVFLVGFRTDRSHAYLQGGFLVHGSILDGICSASPSWSWSIV